jgi:hypothetical protein
MDFALASGQGRSKNERIRSEIDSEFIDDWLHGLLKDEKGICNDHGSSIPIIKLRSPAGDIYRL